MQRRAGKGRDLSTFKRKKTKTAFHMRGKNMSIKLSKEIQKPLIIEGFPGFGLVGAITTEFLIGHLKTELVGEILMPEMPATIAIHENKIVRPVSLYYNEKYNLLIVHSITAPQGLEWKLADKIIEIAKQVNAWEIICIEGVGTSTETDESNAYFFTTREESRNKLTDAGLKELKEGIIIGVTSALMVKSKDIETTSLFAETHSQLPDSKAAAKIIEILDKYLGLEIDYKPLLDTAKEFEQKIKGILNQSSKTETERDRKTMSYVG